MFAKDHIRYRHVLLADMCKMMNRLIHPCSLSDAELLVRSCCSNQRATRNASDLDTSIVIEELLVALQAIIDHTLYIPDKKGKNLVKCETSDIGYLIWRAAKDSLSLRTPIWVTSEQLIEYIYQDCKLIINGREMVIANDSLCIGGKQTRKRVDLALDTQVFDPEICKFGIARKYLQPAITNQHKCSIPSCTELVWRDNLCRFHYREEYCNSRQ